MKRLKYVCPFGGKEYPVYAVIGALLLSMIIGVFENVSPRTMLAMVIFFPLIAVVVCFFFEHRLTDGEMQIMSESSYPLWNPVPPELRALVADRHRTIPTALLIICVTAVLCVMPVSFMTRSGDGISVGPLVVVALIIGGAILVDSMRRSAWMNMDDSAVFTLVPIDHMYDVEHKNNRSRITTYSSYMVFYLPDGRYVLPVKKGEGATDTLAIFKYRGFVTWLPFHM